MPDLTVETGWYCASNERWEVEVTGSKGDVYHVRWEKILDHRITEAEYGWTCECKRFEFHPREQCKHINKIVAEGRRCAWNSEMTPGGPDPVDGRCPKCGGPVLPFRVAV